MAGAEVTGELRVGGVGSTNLSVLPDLARRFRRRHPRAGLCVFEGSEEAVDWVDQGVVDSGCVVDGVAIMNEDHPLAAQRYLTLTDLAEDPFIATTSGCDRSCGWPIGKLACRSARRTGWSGHHVAHHGPGRSGCEHDPIATA
jgi:DNA-binding transcriptional LysR family regulator